MNIIGLNPSTADAYTDDMTSRRCISFAKRFGYGSLVMTNITPIRATKRAEMHKLRLSLHPDKVDRNIKHVQQMAFSSDVVILAWSADGVKMQTDIRLVLTALRTMIGDDGSPGELFVFGDLTKEGQPRHPLYLKKDTPLNLVNHRQLYAMGNMEIPK